MFPDNLILLEKADNRRTADETESYKLTSVHQPGKFKFLGTKLISTIRFGLLFFIPAPKFLFSSNVQQGIV